MGASFRVPSELTEFVERSPSRSMLIRGEAGTGKTTLALTLLTTFPGQRVFISNRVPLSELEQDYPWLRSEGSTIQVIESTARDDVARDRARSMEKSGDLVDARSDRHLIEGLWLPDSVTDAYSRVPPGQRGMIVVDSWDALVERYVGSPSSTNSALPDRAEIERTLIGLMERSHVQLVLIVERDSPSQLDYLVDGVVFCTTQHDGGRLERWIHLKKLRGVRITHASYPFSLEGARFECFVPLHGSARPILRPPEPDPSPTPGFIWPGLAQFAENFGRLPIGRATLIETDLDVSSEAAVLFCTPIFSEVARLGGRAFHILPPRASPETVLRAYRALVSDEEFVRTVRIFSPLSSPTTGSDAAILSRVMIHGLSPVPDDTTPRMQEGIRFLAEGGDSGAPNIIAVWLTGLEHASVGAANPYTRTNLPVIVERVLESAPMHMIMVGPSSHPFTEGMREMASIRIEMQSKHGRVFVYGRAPHTPPLVIADGEGRVAYELIRIV
ncbi:MAG TPA: gas vesicle protein GvpD P-loop domain-containing protein [Thermoplasmata archaeon]|nr:gas vesicle protein GvpD P-loop domain-containing protein [Thermoplasmata archaeon]